MVGFFGYVDPFISSSTTRVHKNIEMNETFLHNYIFILLLVL